MDSSYHLRGVLSDFQTPFFSAHRVCFLLLLRLVVNFPISMETQPAPEQQQTVETPSNNTQNKRPVKPEEQALIDEFQELSEKYGQLFPAICSFVKKGKVV